MHCHTELITRWSIAASVLLLFGILFDVTSFGIDWGSGTSDTSFTEIGLFGYCNGSRVVTRRDKLETTRSDASCVRLISAENWSAWAFGMEVVALLCTILCLVGLAFFLGGHRYDWFRSRSILVVILPLAILASAFNLIGSIIYGVKLEEMGYQLSHGFRLDCCASVFYTFTVVAALLDIQGVCIPKRHGVKNLSKPF